MINRLTALSAITLLASTLTVNAATVEVHYEGFVNNIGGDGAGYSVNDKVSGSLFINTDLASADRDSSASRGYYDNSYNQNNGFVTGHNNAGTRSYDYVDVRDDYYSTYDYYSVRDYEYNYYNNGQGNYGYSSDYLQVWAYDYILDFITGDGIEQLFDLSAGDAQYMNGRIYSYGYDYENGVRTDYHWGSANLTLSRLSVGSASTVPEPGTLALLTLGLAGFGFRKRLIA
jgi:hypothetical protein